MPTLTLPSPPAPSLPDFVGPDDESIDDDDFAVLDFSGEAPEAKKILNTLRAHLGDVNDYHQRLEQAYNTRFCLWPGQSTDGRKRRAQLGREPFPWEGASDARVRLAEEVIRENVARCKAAWYRGQMQAAAHDSDKLESSALATELLTWVMKTQMMPDVRDAIDFAANWRETYGLSIMRVGWERETRMEPQTMTLDKLAEAAIEQALNSPEGQAAGQAQDAQRLGQLAMESVQETLEQLMDPGNEKVLVEEIRDMAPYLTRQQAVAIVTELRETGTTTYPAPRDGAINRPVWTPLRPMVDVFFPRATRRLRDAPWIAQVEWLTRDELRAKVTDPLEQWDEDFVKEVEANGQGKVIDETIEAIDGTYELESLVSDMSQGMHPRGYGLTESDYRDLYQVLRVYYRAVDRKGFPGIYEAVVHPVSEDRIGKSGLLACSHGRFPFVDFRRERFHPAMIDSRGVPEIIETEQEAIKVQRDSRTDRTELTTLPPLKVRANRGSGTYPVMPGGQVPERQNGSTEFMQIPPFDGVTLQIEEATREDVARYFGRASQTGDPATAQLIQQDGVDDFLADITDCVTLTWADMQDYMSPVAVNRVLGSASAAAPLQVSREEIQGNYDFYLTYDVRDADTEFLARKIELLNTAALPSDTEGVIQRGRYTARLMRAIDPHAAADVLRDPQAAVQSEIDDEKDALAKIFGGIEPALVEGGNHAARLQTLQESLQKNPNLMQRYESDEIYRAMVDARMQMHQHQLEQQQNAQIGRVGAAPTLP